MRILVYTKSLFILEEINKNSSFVNKIIHLDSLVDLDRYINHIDILVHNITDFPEDKIEIQTKIEKKNDSIKLLALTNIPDEIEGVAYLKSGYKGYLHSYSNSDILKAAIDSILAGNIYIYPKLMQFLISQIHIKSINYDENLLKNLTKKELEVLEYVSKGLSNNKIAIELNIAEVTVKKHISSMFKKLEVKDRISLALFLKNN